MDNKDLKTIYFAGGCFWGTQHFFQQVQGVVETETGYANSAVPNPTYREVCSGNTGAAETVRVVYDPKRIPLRDLVKLYYLTIDPTLLNRQGMDRGLQYRTGIYYTDPADRVVIEDVTRHVAAGYKAPIMTQVLPLENFYPAEDYHQDYLYNNPGGYCHLNPSLFRIAREYHPSQEDSLK